MVIIGEATAHCGSYNAGEEVRRRSWHHQRLTNRNHVLVVGKRRICLRQHRRSHRNPSIIARTCPIGSANEHMRSMWIEAIATDVRYRIGSMRSGRFSVKTAGLTGAPSVQLVSNGLRAQLRLCFPTDTVEGLTLAAGA